jgi:hypothetical protein
LLHHAAAFGIVTGTVAVDMAKVRQRKREMVEGLIAAHLDLYRQSGAELILGDGRFVAPKTLARDALARRRRHARAKGAEGLPQRRDARRSRPPPASRTPSRSRTSRPSNLTACPRT